MIYTTNYGIFRIKRKDRAMKFGEIVKGQRIRLGLTLRAFCLKNSHDPSNWSKMERGVIPPPKEEGILKKIAGELSIDEDSEFWLEFHDSAFLDRGEIPPYVREDKAAMAKLPLFFRTVSGSKPSEEELDQLAQFLMKNP